MLRITAKDFDLLLKVRETLIQVNEGLPADPETVEQFILYTKELEERKEKDLEAHREALPLVVGDSFYRSISDLCRSGLPYSPLEGGSTDCRRIDDSSRLGGGFVQLRSNALPREES